MIKRLTKQDNILNGKFYSSKRSINGAYPTHWHEFFEIEYILSGNGTYNIDGKDYIVEDDMLFFMSPVNFHTPNLKNTDLINTAFAENVCSSQILSVITTGNFPIAFKIKKEDTEFFQVLFGELIKSNDDMKYFSVILETIISKLIRSYVPSHTGHTTPFSTSELYILNHFRDNITLNDVASYSGFSSSYFSAVFKEKTGMNFKKYITSLKLDYAKKLLEFSDYNIMQICVECGFEDYTNFLKRFKNLYGMTPKMYRNSLLKNKQGC